LASGEAISRRWGVKASELARDHEAWSLEAEYLALGILAIVYVASPHRVVLGGGVMQQPSLLPLVRGRLRELNCGYLDTPMLEGRIDDYLVPPVLGDRAGVLGGIALAAGLAR
jgi:fructokinase